MVSNLNAKTIAIFISRLLQLLPDKIDFGFGLLYNTNWKLQFIEYKK